jgi:hypothetical protein
MSYILSVLLFLEKKKKFYCIHKILIKADNSAP